MAGRAFVGLAVAAAVAFLLAMSAFTVRETQLAIKFSFGKIVNAEYGPGLHFMVPVVNNVRKFEKRILTRTYPSEQFLTSEGKILRIDFYVKYRIADVGRYYQASQRGDEEIAAGRLGSIVKDGIKGVIARRYPYNYQMGLGYEGTHDALPGIITVGMSEQNQRGFYKRWAEFMAARSWADLSTAAVDTPSAGR